MMLYAAGDSFTFGDELAHPERDAWPVILSNLISNDNTSPPPVSNDYVNISGCGVSNQFIVDNTIAWFAKNLSNNVNDTIAIIGFTSENRFRICIKTDEYYEIIKTQNNRWVCMRTTSIEGYRPQNKQHDMSDKVLNTINSMLIKFLPHVALSNQEYNMYIKYQHMLTVHNMLEINRIPHVFFNAFNRYDKPLNVSKYKDKDIANTIEFIARQIKHCMLDIDMRNFCVDNNYAFAPYGHPLEEGHKAWAEYLYTELKTRGLIKNR